MIKQVFSKVVNQHNLSPRDAESVMREIMSGKVSPIKIGAFLTALRLKGETIEEISSFARVMRDFAINIQTKNETVLDTCGTGGAPIKTINVSTAVSFIIAGLGFSVAKHGNRSVTSKSGSADVLEYFGHDLNLTPKEVEQQLHSTNVCFMFAPRFHPAMKHAVTPRKELGIRTVFNILGPLANPAFVRYQVLGVFSPDLTELMANVLAKLGTKHALVVHGMGGLDEISNFSKTKITELTEDGTISTYSVTPADFGIEISVRSAVEKRASAASNAKDIVGILNGKTGPLTDLVLMNAAGGLKALGDIPFKKGVELAQESIESGRAYKKLKEFIKVSSPDLSVLKELEEA
jgi:anthranilate phosphoribosyltransferase